MVLPATKDVQEDVELKTTCYGCPAGTCGMIARRVNGIVVSVRGDPDCPFSQGKLCAKGQAQIMMAYSSRRVTKPLKRTNPEKGIGVDPKWVEISYEEAIATAAKKLAECRAKDPAGMVYATSDFSTLPWFLGSVMGSFGTPNFSSGGLSFCGNIVHPALQQVHGGFHAGPDFHHANYVMLIGSAKGAMSNWAAVTATLEMARARKRGTRLVVVDPVCSNAASIADEWVPIRPGTDGALVLAMLNVMLNELGLYDRPFLEKLSNGPYLVRDRDGRYARDAATNKPMIWDAQDGAAKCHDDPSLSLPALEGHFEVSGEACTPAFALLKRHLTDYTPEHAAEITTVPADTIRRLAKEFGTAASIGETIEIDGVTLPLRPACAHWYKGISQHAKSFEQGLAIAMLNTVVGAIDVPGGLLADTVYAHHPKFADNNTWMGKESGICEADGLVVPGRFASYAGAFPSPFPLKKVEQPVSMQGDPLVAAGSYMSAALAKINVLEPKTFKNAIPHNPQVYVQVVGNDMLNEGNPKVQAEYLKKFAFHLSIVPNIDETAEFADIVIPTQTQLERLDMGANNIPDTMGSTATEEYCINLRQPVVDIGNRHHVDVWVDIAEKAGFLGDFNAMVNHFMELQGNFQLNPERKYDNREMTERWIGSMTGGQLTLADVAKEGRLKWKKSVQERYPRHFYKARIPVYYEYHLDAGEMIKGVTEKLGIPWDVSRYKPLPGWYPGPGYGDDSDGFDLYGVSYKQTFKTATFSNFNPWLVELGRYHPLAGKIILNRRTAERLGIGEGERIRVENRRGRVLEGEVHLSECIHPECVGMDHNGGNWAKSLPPRPKGTDTGVHFGELLDYDMKNLDVMDGAFEASPKVRVSKAVGGRK
ncbi:MAG: molybdopterin-dependent oxidoreductase [Betaproteobacteria bacterium]|nr:molybdopterin-dependent oxidoreductase [Betaproteobacteria bacterium]